MFDYYNSISIQEFRFVFVYVFNTAALLVVVCKFQNIECRKKGMLFYLKIPTKYWPGGLQCSSFKMNKF